MADKDFQFAKQMVEEIPQAAKALEDSYDSLTKYKNFNSVAKVLSVIEGSILHLETSLPYFQNIVKDKGGQVD